MVLHSKPRRALCAAMLLFAGLGLTACATIPPQQITGTLAAGEPTQTPDETALPGNSAETPAEGDPAPSPTALTASRAADTGEAPTKVELFYSGMPSLMGFADASQTTLYENTMDALPACVSLVWPQASVSYYRYGADVPKDAMALTKDQLLSHVGDPSFYLDTAMTKEPARVKFEGQAVATAQRNMNEPIQSFYDAMKMPAPEPQSGVTGTRVAVNAGDPEQLTVIVTDLHELRIDDGALLSALNEKCLQAGRSIGVAAICSEFSGLIPDLGESKTSFVWGSPPSGTLDFTLDYTDYKMGISIDPEARKMASRPFYVLVIGGQSAVSQYLSALTDRLTHEFSGNATFKMDTAVFGSGYVPADYTLAGHMRYVAGQGVTAVAEPVAPAGVALIELKASQQARYLEWDVDYRIHPADPRGLGVTSQDFIFTTTAVSDTGAETPLPDLTWRIVSAEGGTVKLRLRLDLPAGILPRGNYQIDIAGSLAAPLSLPGSEWLSKYGYDADGAQLFDMEQNIVAFDGSRTLFLSRLIDTLGKANIGRLGTAPLGSVRVALTVYA